jgi:hypothetical protein
MSSSVSDPKEFSCEGIMYADMEKEVLDSAGGGVAMMTRVCEE